MLLLELKGIMASMGCCCKKGFIERLHFKTCFSGYGSPIGQLYRTVNDLYKQALDAGEVDCDF